MIWICIIIILSLLVYLSPYVDIFTDYRDKKHIIIWFNSKGRRKHFDLMGNSE